MAAQSLPSKLLVEVEGPGLDGEIVVQNMKLQTRHGWERNLQAIRKKISRKFDVEEEEYALEIEGCRVESDDFETLKKVMASFDWSKTPHFKIVFGEDDCKHIIVHYGDRDDTFVQKIKGDINDLDESVFDELWDGTKAYFEIQGPMGRLYEEVNGKPVYVEDWDDLFETLDDEDLQELHLFVENKRNKRTPKKKPKLTASKNKQTPQLENTSRSIREEQKRPLGRPCPVVSRSPKKRVSLVFVGETGVGKTTLLTSLEDFINGVPFEEVKPTEKPKTTGLSQTMDTAQYQLSNDEWAVNIIDTPGIGDTSAAQRDQEHMGNIIDFLGNFGGFNAVCILLKRGTRRLTTRMRYIINELRSNMPKDVQSNFIVIMTRSDVPVPDADTMAVIKGLHLPIGNIIPVNNCAYEQLDLSKCPPGSPILKIVKERQRRDYKANHEYLQILLETARKMKPYQGGKMLDLKTKRDLLKERVAVLKMTVDDSFKIEMEIKEQMKALEEAKSDEELNKAFVESNKHTEYEYYPEHGKITIHCNACSNACHIGTRLGYGDDLNDAECAGLNGRCKKCGCSMNCHTHLGWKARAKTVTNEDKKRKFLDAQDRKRRIERRKKELSDDLKRVEQKRWDCTKEIQEKYKELESIAIIGYNESFEHYMVECQRAVARDPDLTREQKEKKMTMFAKSLSQFKLLKDAINGGLKGAGNYVTNFN